MSASEECTYDDHLFALDLLQACALDPHPNHLLAVAGAEFDPVVLLYCMGRCAGIILDRINPNGIAMARAEIDSLAQEWADSQ